jgi:hypothetical protein
LKFLSTIVQMPMHRLPRLAAFCYYKEPISHRQSWVAVITKDLKEMDHDISKPFWYYERQRRSPRRTSAQAQWDSPTPPTTPRPPHNARKCNHAGYFKTMSNTPLAPDIHAPIPSCFDIAAYFGTEQDGRWYNGVIKKQWLDDEYGEDTEEPVVGPVGQFSMNDGKLLDVTQSQLVIARDLPHAIIRQDEPHTQAICNANLAHTLTRLHELKEEERAMVYRDIAARTKNISSIIPQDIQDRYNSRTRSSESLSIHELGYCLARTSQQAQAQAHQNHTLTMELGSNPETRHTIVGKHNAPPSTSPDLYIFKLVHTILAREHSPQVCSGSTGMQHPRRACRYN